MHDVANARDDGARHSLRRQPRRLLHAAPQKQDDEKGQIEKGVGGERRDGARGRDDDAADRRAEAARDIVADAVERDGGGQRLRRHLFADRRLPRGPEQRHSAADDEAEDEQEDGRHDARPSERRERNRRRPERSTGRQVPRSADRTYPRSRRRASTTNATGSVSAVWTSATMPADELICVIAHAAPTPMIKRPRLDSRLALQMRRKTACRNGERTPLFEVTRLFAKPTIMLLDNDTGSLKAPGAEPAAVRAGLTGRRRSRSAWQANRDACVLQRAVATAPCARGRAPATLDPIIAPTAPFSVAGTMPRRRLAASGGPVRCGSAHASAVSPRRSRSEMDRR